MQFINVFQEFDPIKDALEGEFPIILKNIAERARKIIKGRSLKEIEFALYTINYFLARAVYGPEEINESDNSAVKVFDDSDYDKMLPKDEALFGPAQVLLTQVEYFNILNQKSFPKAEWEEYFAVLALAVLGDLYRIYKSDNEASIATVGLAAEAMEAIMIAETSGLTVPALDKPLKQRISLKNRENAIRGHEALNVWKAKFRKWYDTKYLPSLGGSKPNKREAARLFEEKFMGSKREPDQPLEIGEQKDLVRTLADSLPKKPRSQYS